MYRKSCVALSEECSGDEYIMSRMNVQEDVRSTAHLPYEVLVQDGQAYALHPKSRIAVNFPDLTMMGQNSFFSIVCAPNAIQNALRQVVGLEPRVRDGDDW